MNETHSVIPAQAGFDENELLGCQVVHEGVDLGEQVSLLVRRLGTDC